MRIERLKGNRDKWLFLSDVKSTASVKNMQRKQAKLGNLPLRINQ